MIVPSRQKLAVTFEQLACHALLSPHKRHDCQGPGRDTVTREVPKDRHLREDRHIENEIVEYGAET
jgi:hypothetical protein